MSSLAMIAALTWPGRVIGREGALPWKLSQDLKRFKALTMGHPVIMGRKTWEGLPFKLPGRTNIVLSRSTELRPSPQGEAPDLTCASLDAALAAAGKAEGGGEAFVIGGAEVYALALPRAERLHLTLVHHDFKGDATFPPFELADWWERSRERHHQAGEQSFDFEFLALERP